MQREQAAFSQLYDRYATLVYTMVLRIVKSTGEAEDLLQEIFVQIWNKSTFFAESKGSVYTWVMTIARRKAIDKVRSQEYANRGSSLDDDDAIALPDAAYEANPLHAAITTEYEELMQTGLAMLSDEQRTIIELSYYEGFTQAQIAERLKVPLGTVKTRMRQGLIKLRDYLKGRIQEK
ncbi:MAG: sigma-70 family RNA polymerase sigma factor [Bacteroidota bacterium]